MDGYYITRTKVKKVGCTFKGFLLSFDRFINVVCAVILQMQNTRKTEIIVQNDRCNQQWCQSIDRV